MRGCRAVARGRALSSTHARTLTDGRTPPRRLRRRARRDAAAGRSAGRRSSARCAHRAAHLHRLERRRGRVPQRTLGNPDRRSRARRHALFAQRRQAVHAGVEPEDHHRRRRARAARRRVSLDDDAVRARRRSGTACWTAISSCAATAIHRSARTCAATRSRRCATWPTRCARAASRASAAASSPRRRRSPTPPLGFGWAWDDLDEPYGAGVDALLLQRGVHADLRARGRARRATRCARRRGPASTYPPLIVRATTVARSSAPRRQRAESPDAHASGYDSSHTGVLVAGTIAVGDTAVMELAHRGIIPAPTSPRCARRCARRGSRGRRSTRATRTATLDSLLAMRSPPLREVLPALREAVAEPDRRASAQDAGAASDRRRTRRQRARAWSMRS